MLSTLVMICVWLMRFFSSFRITGMTWYLPKHSANFQLTNVSYFGTLDLSDLSSFSVPLLMSLETNSSRISLINSLHPVSYRHSCFCPDILITFFFFFFFFFFLIFWNRRSCSDGAFWYRPLERHPRTGGERSSRIAGHHSRRCGQAQLCSVLSGCHLFAGRFETHSQGAPRRNTKVNK